MANKRGQGEGSISRRPDGTWWARITLGKDENGKQKRRAFYGKTRKEVQEKLTAALSEYNKGTLINPSRMSVDEWIDHWLKNYKKHVLRPSTYLSYYEIHKNRIVPTIGRVRLDNLNTDMVQKMVASLIDKGLSSSSIDKAMMVLKSALSQAVKNGIISKNPALGATAPRKEYAKKEVLTMEEQTRFMQHVAGKTRYAPIYYLILATGMRIGETLALTWNDVDFENQVITVNKTQSTAKDPFDPKSKLHSYVAEPKTKTSVRIVPMLSSISNMLAEIKAQHKKMGLMHEGNCLVFQGLTGNMFFQTKIRKDIKIQAAAAGITKDISPHCLRHTFATRGLECGVPLKVMQEYLGHSSITMTADLYTHVLHDTKMDSIKLLEETMLPLGSQDNPDGNEPQR